MSKRQDALVEKLYSGMQDTLHRCNGKTTIGDLTKAATKAIRAASPGASPTLQVKTTSPLVFTVNGLPQISELRLDITKTQQIREIDIIVENKT